CASSEPGPACRNPVRGWRWWPGLALSPVRDAVRSSWAFLLAGRRVLLAMVEDGPRPVGKTPGKWVSGQVECFGRGQGVNGHQGGGGGTGQGPAGALEAVAGAGAHHTAAAWYRPRLGRLSRPATLAAEASSTNTPSS